MQDKNLSFEVSVTMKILVYARFIKKKKKNYWQYCIGMAEKSQNILKISRGNI